MIGMMRRDVFRSGPLARLSMVAVLVMTALSVGATSAASATNVLEDGFETATAAQWTVSGSGAGNSGGLYMDCGAAHSGCGGAMIQQLGPGWNSVGRSVYVLRQIGHRCQLAGYAQRRLYGGQELRVNVEVIDPATWTYLGLATYSLLGPGSGRWERISVIFYPTKPYEHIRFSVLGDAASHENMVNLDDVSVVCS